MAATPVLRLSEWNLMMADFLRMHIHLKKSLRLRIRAHPDAPVPVGHSASVSGMRCDGLQQLAVPIDQPRRFVAILRNRHIPLLSLLNRKLLLSDPQALRRD